MINELWNRFPRLLEENINGLLEGAAPTRMKAFHLYKACKSEGLWSNSFEDFAEHLERFFLRPKFDRTKSAFDSYLKQPMDHKLFEEFYLDFRTAEVSDKAVYEIASWAHNIMRLRRKTNIANQDEDLDQDENFQQDSEQRIGLAKDHGFAYDETLATGATFEARLKLKNEQLKTDAVISLDVMNRTLKSITSPSFYAKARNIEFDDFSHAWKKVVHKLHGQKFDAELNSLIEELDQINIQLKLTENETAESGLTPIIPLTHLEIDWVIAVHAAATEEKPAPKFPLPQGPSKRLLLELERVVTLYQIVQITSQPELLRHRSNIRVTLLDRCETLLGRHSNVLEFPLSTPNRKPAA